MFLVYIVLLTLAIGIGFFIRFLFYHDSFTSAWLTSNAPIFLVLILVGSVLITFMEYKRWIIRVEDGDKVEGPSGAFGERLSIPLKEIDWARTHRSLGSWFKFGNAIYVSPRVRILISPWFFNPGRFREFLDAIGYPQD